MAARGHRCGVASTAASYSPAEIGRSAYRICATVRWIRASVIPFAALAWRRSWDAMVGSHTVSNGMMSGSQKKSGQDGKVAGTSMTSPTALKFLEIVPETSAALQGRRWLLQKRK